MDEELSKEIIKDLEEEEIEAVGQEIAKLRLIPHDVVTKVHEEFVEEDRRQEEERRRRRDASSRCSSRRAWAAKRPSYSWGTWNRGGACPASS